MALCPGFVETAMTEFIRDQVPAEEMIRTSDIAEAVRFLLHVCPACVVPEIVFQRPGETAVDRASFLDGVQPSVG